VLNAIYLSGTSSKGLEVMIACFFLSAIAAFVWSSNKKALKFV
jgi:hypothetical protein